MTLTQYIRAIRRRAWLLLLMPALAVGAAVAVTSQLPPTYQSDVTLLVRPAQPISSLDPNSAAISADQVSRTYAQLMTQRPLLEKVIADLKLHNSASQLQSAVQVTPQANSTVLKVTVQDRDPRLARDIANKLVEDFITQTKQIQQSQVDQYTAKIEGQLDTLRKQIEKEQSRIDQLQTQAGISPTSGGQSQSQSGQSRTAPAGLKPEEQSELANLQQQITLDRTQYFNIVSNESSIEVNVARSADNVLVISPAVEPVVPTSPKLWLNVLVAAFGGAAVAIGLIILLEQLDQSVRTDEQLAQRTGLLPLANIPSWSAGRRGDKELAVLQKDASLAEPYRTLRTNILFSTIDRRLRTIAVSSAVPREGKSRTAANLAVALAVAGHRTVLVDCDFRRPTQHRLFGRVRNLGLADLILAEATEADAIAPVEKIPNLWLLSSGPTPPNPSELLGSGRMRELLARLTDTFTYVVIDTPPVNLVADALVLGSYTDATILVVEHGRSRYPAVKNARESLERVGTRVLGGVLNKVPARGGYRYYHYNYSSNGKPGKGHDSKDAAKVLAGVSSEPPAPAAE